jgi:hypothetical protein
MVAAGDNNDVEMDGGSVKDGDMNSCGQPALPPEKVNLRQYSGPVYAIKNRTCIKEPKSTQLTR